MEISLFFGAGAEVECRLPRGIEMAFDLMSDLIETHWEDISSKLSTISGKNFREFLNRTAGGSRKIHHTRFQSQEISTLVSLSIRKARKLFRKADEAKTLKECTKNLRTKKKQTAYWNFEGDYLI